MAFLTSLPWTKSKIDDLSVELMTLVMLLIPVHMYMSMSVLWALWMVKVEVMLYPSVLFVMVTTSVTLVKKSEGEEARDHMISGVGIPNTSQVNVRVSVWLTTREDGTTDRTIGGSDEREPLKDIITMEMYYSLVTNKDDSSDGTTNVFPGAPLLLATQW